MIAVQTEAPPMSPDRGSYRLAHFRTTCLACVLVIAHGVIAASLASAASPADARFDREVKPILESYCFGCHADGAREGSMSFDELFAMADREKSNERWYRVLKQLQAGLMPPADEDQPSPEEVGAIVHWIKYAAFGLDPDLPDPGHVTVRRLNQVEYRNTIRDLLDVDFDTTSNFPADDTGHGFDNIGEVLSISPLLLEKYVNAAKEIVSSVVPTVSGIIRVKSIPGSQFQFDLPSVAASIADGERDTTGDRNERNGGAEQAEAEHLELSYYTPATATADLAVDRDGDYLLRLNMTARETYVDNQFDSNRCEFTFSFDDEPLLKREFVRQGRKNFVFEFPKSLSKGHYQLRVTVKPLSEDPQIRNLRFEIDSVDLVGPDDPQYYEKPPGYERFFPRDVPQEPSAKDQYARKLLSDFAARAFRRPVEQESVERLVDLAKSVYREGGGTFESGIAKSMTAILASPRFLFREESIVGNASDPYPLIDQYALASRISYFLWSTMPDEELTRLAQQGKLREQLDEQIARMLRHPKAGALSENFVGQWLRARAIDTIQINAAAVLQREPADIDPDSDVRRKRFFELFRKGNRRTAEENEEFEIEKETFRQSFRGGSRFELTDDLRQAMRRETELLFEHIVNQDRSLLEMIDSDYTFLNEDLWAHYQIGGIEAVQGDEMRLVRLPADSLRGGVLTQGTVLAVTSNPDRTSPVKRGLFILENLLGSPPAAPPPNIPALEDVESDSTEKLSLRETLAIHRANSLCASCHDQMDPLGLALENFNAIGRYRTHEFDEPIDASGTLTSGSQFSTIGELKHILVTEYQTDIYRCMTEKMLTYALGRAVEYRDAHTIDELVASLEKSEGKASSLIYGIIHSSAFQRARRPAHNVARLEPEG